MSSACMSLDIWRQNKLRLDLNLDDLNNEETQLDRCLLVSAKETTVILIITVTNKTIIIVIYLAY